MALIMRAERHEAWIQGFSAFDNSINGSGSSISFSSLETISSREGGMALALCCSQIPLGYMRESLYV